jgi:hypothetical protein
VGAGGERAAVENEAPHVHGWCGFSGSKGRGSSPLPARADLLKRMLTMRSSGWFGWWFCWMHRRGRVSQRVMTLTNDFFFTRSACSLSLSVNRRTHNRFFSSFCAALDSRCPNICASPICRPFHCPQSDEHSRAIQRHFTASQKSSLISGELSSLAPY